MLWTASKAAAPAFTAPATRAVALCRWLPLPLGRLQPRGSRREGSGGLRAVDCRTRNLLTAQCLRAYVNALDGESSGREVREILKVNFAGSNAGAVEARRRIPRRRRGSPRYSLGLVRILPRIAENGGSLCWHGGLSLIRGVCRRLRAGIKRTYTRTSGDCRRIRRVIHTDGSSDEG